MPIICNNHKFENNSWTIHGGQTRPNRRDVLFTGPFASQKVLMKILALLGAKREREHREGGGRGKAPIIKAAFWFDRKLFSSHRHLRTRVLYALPSPHPRRFSGVETRNSLFESSGWRKCWQISERGASAGAGKQNQWWKENAELPLRFNQSPSRSPPFFPPLFVLLFGLPIYRLSRLSEPPFHSLRFRFLFCS